MDKTNEETFIKQRKTHISKSVESFQNLMRSSNASDLTDLNRLIFDQNDTKKLIDKHQQTNSSNNYSLTIENICWFVVSIVSIYVSDIFRVLMYDSRINRVLLVGSFTLICINLIIAFYMIIWLTHIKKISSNEWNEKHPTLIPIATACFISGSILLTISIWPVYSWLTAPLLFTIFMGFIVVLINLPDWF